MSVSKEMNEAAAAFLKDEVQRVFDAAIEKELPRIKAELMMRLNGAVTVDFVRHVGFGDALEVRVLFRGFDK